MIVSLFVILCSLIYFFIKREIILSIIFVSTILQYHVKYYLHIFLDTSNYKTIYGNVFDHNIYHVNFYLDCLLTSTTFLVLVFYVICKRKENYYFKVFKPSLLGNYLFIFATWLSFIFSIEFRFFDMNSEENFSTMIHSFITATLCFSGIFFNKKPIYKYIGFYILFFSCILIGFRSLLFFFFLSLILVRKNIFKLKDLKYYFLFIIAIICTTLLRVGNISNIFNTIFDILTSHYDSWSYLIIAFETSVVESENFTNWLYAFLSIIPGAKRFFGIETYGHYLNRNYASEWFDNVNVILPPGLIGEFLSLGSSVPFFALPLIIVLYYALSVFIRKRNIALYVLMVGWSFFLLESPLSNMGGLFKLGLIIILLSFVFRITLNTKALVINEQKK